MTDATQHDDYRQASKQGPFVETKYILGWVSEPQQPKAHWAVNALGFVVSRQCGCWLADFAAERALTRGLLHISKLRQVIASEWFSK